MTRLPSAVISAITFPEPRSIIGQLVTLLQSVYYRCGFSFWFCSLGVDLDLRSVAWNWTICPAAVASDRSSRRRSVGIACTSDPPAADGNARAMYAFRFLPGNPGLDFNLLQFLIRLLEGFIVEIEGGLLLEPLPPQFRVGLHGLLKRQRLPILCGFRRQRPG